MFDLRNMPGPTITDRRSELADFLRSRRTRLEPPTELRAWGSARRRTPGLRREELAQLAGLSVDWYTRLEQGRDVNPSRDTLEAIARALKLDEHERGHLFYLADADGLRQASLVARDEQAEPAMQQALVALNVPALVIGPRLDVLAWNQALSRLLIPFESIASERRNLLWLTFQHAPLRERYLQIELVESQTVAAFRFNAGSFVGHPDFDSLIAELDRTSEAFGKLWQRHDVRPKTGGEKAFVVGGEPLWLTWHTLNSATGTRQQLVYYTSKPGTEHERRLAQLLAAT